MFTSVVLRRGRDHAFVDPGQDALGFAEVRVPTDPSRPVAVFDETPISAGFSCPERVNAGAG
jgi:hypothetical protein